MRMIKSIDDFSIVTNYMMSLIDLLLFRKLSKSEKYIVKILPIYISIIIRNSL